MLQSALLYHQRSYLSFSFQSPKELNHYKLVAEYYDPVWVEVVHAVIHKKRNYADSFVAFAYMYATFEMIGIVVHIAVAVIMIVVIDNSHLGIAYAYAMMMPEEVLHDLYIDEVVWFAVSNDDTFLGLLSDYLMVVRSAFLMVEVMVVMVHDLDYSMPSSCDNDGFADTVQWRCYFDGSADKLRGRDFVGIELESYFDDLLTDKEPASHLAGRTLVYYLNDFAPPNNHHNYCTLQID